MSSDLTLVLLALCVGLMPLMAAMLRGQLGRLNVVALAAIALSFAACALGAALMNSRPATSSPPLGTPHVVHEDRYVGSDACRSCHPYQYATWHASYHRTMTQLASPESIPAPFDGTDLHLEGVSWRLDRRGDEFWVDGQDDHTEVQLRVAMATGSHNYQLYWLESENGLHQFPLVYLLQEREWIPRKARFLQPPIERTLNETGRWKSHCIKCHATRGRKEVLPSKETHVAELGISCEACHGPGGHHIEANQMPLRRLHYHLSGEPDPTIVNPRRLPHDRATEVCGQCHSIEIILDKEKADDWIHQGTHYRPGDVLAEYQTTVVGRYEDNPPPVRQYLDNHPSFRLKFCFWSDGMLRVTGRELHGMLETPCYRKGQMSCLSCHTLHRSEHDPRSLGSWANDQLGPGMEKDQACLQCHQKYDDAQVIVAHTHHRIDSAGSTCYNCHMPYTTWGLLRAIRSHTVNSPNVAASVATGRPNACNQCHLDQTLLWTAEKLKEWYKFDVPDLTREERETAASVMWALRGDAGQRALMAWSMGWNSAREASGSGWMVPYLTTLMMDPYHAVRFNAQRSLHGYAEYAGLTADLQVGATEEQQRDMVKQILSDWEKTFPGSSGKKESRLLILPDGRVDMDRFENLSRQRSNEMLVLFE